MSFWGPPMPPAEPNTDSFVRQNLRHNVLALGADLGFFFVGLSFASQSTILPAFASHLGAPNVVIGAIPAVMTLGWFLPSLFAAGHTEALPQKLPFVLRYTVWERVPFLVLAVAAFFLAEWAPALTLAVLLIMLFVITGVGGVLLPAWMDIVGRAIPTNLRGRFFAVASLVGSAGGFAGSFATAYILGALAAPQSYGVCFLIATLFMGFSYIGLALTREAEAQVTSRAEPLRTYLSRIPGLLRRNRNLSWFLLARVFSIMGDMGSAFFTVYALAAYGAPASQVGFFTGTFLVGQMIGSIVFGWLADRAGHRVVIMAGVAAEVGANVVALATPSVDLFYLVFALSGVEVAAFNVSALNVLLEFAPVVEEQPTYVGLGNTSLAPVRFVAPLVAGVMADSLGFQAIFVAAAVFGSVSLGLLVVRVRDPRHERAMRA